MRTMSWYIMCSVLTCAIVRTAAITPKKNNKISLIPRAVFFNNPYRSHVQISPDGTKISYRAANTNQALNIWVKSIDADDDVCISSITTKGIGTYWWAYDMTKILYTHDANGSENTQLYAIDLATNTTTNLTPYPDTHVRVLAYHPQQPTRMLIEMNKDDKRYFDVYELDLTTGRSTMREKNPGTITEYFADSLLVIRGALRPLPDGGYQLLTRDAMGNWQPTIDWSLHDSFSQPVQFHRNGTSVYLLDSRDSDTTQFVSVDLTNKQKTVLAQHPSRDIISATLNPITDEPLYAVNSNDRNHMMIIDPPMRADVSTLDQLSLPWSIVSHSTDLQTLIITTKSDITPITYYWYHRPTKQLKRLWSVNPALAHYHLHPMHPVVITSRDGLALHSYLTYPAGDNRTNLPLVLLVHGGPWSAVTWEYDERTQWLANRGYAVLQVNFRGSTGYGKAFVNASIKEWGGKMQDDLIDAVNWAIKNKIADPTRIAIMGMSYGGYAALAGVTFNPDVFCCAVDLFGFSNLVIGTHNTALHDQLFIDSLHSHMGSPITDLAMLKARSPLYHVQRIKKPLLLVSGDHDVRCMLIDTQQLKHELNKYHKPYQYLLFKDEGHGLVGIKNKLTMYAAIEKFLAKHMRLRKINQGNTSHRIMRHKFLGNHTAQKNQALDTVMRTSNASLIGKA